jgi:hypothetical protein
MAIIIHIGFVLLHMNLIKFLFSRGIHIDRIRVPRCTLKSFKTMKTQDYYIVYVFYYCL